MASNEKRLDPRKAVCQPAQLWSVELGAEIICKLLDISASGARLRMPDELTLYRMKWPKRLTLRFPFDQSEIDCTVVRVKGREFGVRFLSPFRNAYPYPVSCVAHQPQLQMRSCG
jgi:hypothetical protein